MLPCYSRVPMPLRGALTTTPSHYLRGQRCYVTRGQRYHSNSTKGGTPWASKSATESHVRKWQFKAVDRWPNPAYGARRWYQKPKPQELEARIAKIPIERFRNFCIVAHIDHGKSTLSDRLLELTGTIVKDGSTQQILDKLDVERERGITVKAQTCSMLYNYKGEDYLLHLVDTPGHVDFRAEVTRSYASCDGALLLIDATQGVQAQTVANFNLADGNNMTVIPVINKIDMSSADIPRALAQMEDMFGMDKESALHVSAKTGTGIAKILPSIIENIPSPTGSELAPLRMLLIDSWYDTYRGVVLLVRIFDGAIKSGDQVVSLASKRKYTVGQVGIQALDAVAQSRLRAGQVGYVYFIPAMRDIKDAMVGDTFTHAGHEDTVQPYPGFEEPKPMVFVSAFPTDQRDYIKIAEHIEHLVLNDRSVTMKPDTSDALGPGWRLGFLGNLHCSVFQDRLRQEHQSNIIITNPSVPVKIEYPVRNKHGELEISEVIVTKAADFPDNEVRRGREDRPIFYEPMVTATITTPKDYLGRVIELCESSRGEQVNIDFFGVSQSVVQYRIPLLHLVEDFFGKLKSSTKGYATLDYVDGGWREADLVKLQLLVNKVPVDPVSTVVPSSLVDRLGRAWVAKFKEHVDRQMFEVIIQAAVGSRIIARDTIKPFRKDVLQKLHASDIGRRQKLLDRQKEGRKRLQSIGSVVIDQESFQKFLAK